MNIIKQIKDENGNNIYPIGYAQGGMKMDLLWTNPSPTSTFAAQTVSLDLSDYNLVLIEFYSNNTVTTYKDVKILPVSGENYAIISGHNVLRSRSVTVSSTGLVFAGGIVVTTYGGNTTNGDGNIVPTRIYGLKLSYIVPTSVHGLQYVEV